MLAADEVGMPWLRLQRGLERFSQYADRWWYAPALALFSALDAYILIVPNEPIIAAGVIAQPKRWVSLSLWMTIGNTLGAVSLAALVASRSHWILSHLVSERMLHSRSWHESLKLIDRHGLWGLTLVSLSPFPQHAAVIIVGLAQIAPWKVFVAVGAGRAPKYFGVGWLAAKSPDVLRRWKILP